MANRMNVGRVLLIGAGVFALIASGVMVASAAGGTINACVNPAGMPRIVDSPAQCKKNESKLSWASGSAAGGISGYQIVSKAYELKPATANQWDVRCPTGKKVLGGGVSATASSAVVFGSKPNGDSAWRGEVFNPKHAGTMTVYAVCANVP